MAKKKDIPLDNHIIEIPIEEAMPDNYLPYAVEVAKERALPDVRDGLKPVHRRILYGAYKLKAFPDKPYYKSARIVGDILGKYHPHGDTSVYEAMVILAQNFSTRMPLIDGHGNWGSPDGDSAAAMRYTEARLSKISLEMLRDIEKESVEFTMNYSDTELEPAVLPSKYPNLLVNGSFGIAVGLSTNIPPHNLNEVIDGTLAYIDNKDISLDGLMEHIKGPDLPTGGELLGVSSIREAYETGYGRVAMRAKTNIEKNDNDRYCIVITEFPYKKNKCRILQMISEMTGDKKHSKALESIADIRDESDRQGTRAVIEFKKSVTEEDANRVLKYLYLKTDLQCNLPFNMVAIADGKPQTLTLKQILSHYVKHQKDVITRRSTFELRQAKKRYHIVEGFIKAIDILDDVIITIRSSKSKSNARENLIAKFGFSEEQSDAILELMLYRLTGLEINEYKKEYKQLTALIKKLEKILGDEKTLLKVIKSELLEVKAKFGDERRTKIFEKIEDIKVNVEDLIVQEEVAITVSNEGYIKRLPMKSYNRVTLGVEDIEYNEGDYHRQLIFSDTKASIVLFTDKGNMYQTKVISLPEAKWKDKGVRINNIIKTLSLDKEKIVYVTAIEEVLNSDIAFITDMGNYKITNKDNFITSYSRITALKLKKDELVSSVLEFKREREQQFIKIKLESGIEFTITEPKLEVTDRMNATTCIVSIPDTEKIVDASVYDTKEYKEFTLDFLKGRIIKKKSKGLKVNTEDKVFVITSLGRSISLSVNLLESIEEYDVAKNFSLEKSEEIVGIIKRQDGEGYICFATEQGYIKKTKLSEFYNDEGINIACKLKAGKDKIINAFYIEEDVDILFLTKAGMVLRTSTELVSEMGKVATGVKGISLKEEDEVILVTDLLQEKIINLSMQSKDKAVLDSKELTRQNRATRGKCILNGTDKIIKIR